MFTLSFVFLNTSSFLTWRLKLFKRLKKQTKHLNASKGLREGIEIATSHDSYSVLIDHQTREILKWCENFEKLFDHIDLVNYEFIMMNYN